MRVKRMSMKSRGLTLLAAYVAVWILSTFLCQHIIIKSSFAKPLFVTVVQLSMTSLLLLPTIPSLVNLITIARDSNIRIYPCLKSWFFDHRGMFSESKRDLLRSTNYQLADPLNQREDFTFYSYPLVNPITQNKSLQEGLLRNTDPSTVDYEAITSPESAAEDSGDDERRDLGNVSPGPNKTLGNFSLGPNKASEAGPIPGPYSEYRAQQHLHVLPFEMSMHEITPPDIQRLSRFEVFKLSLLLGPVWFVGGFTFNYALIHLSVPTSAVLSSCSVILTYGLSVILLKDPFKWSTVGAMSTTLVGIILIALNGIFTHDKPISSPFGNDSVFGFFIGIISALVASIMCILLSMKCPSVESVDVSLLFGFTGFLVLLFGPGLLYLANLHQWEVFEFPGIPRLLFLVTNGLIGTILCNIFWAKAVLLLTPFIVTICSTTQIPLTIFIDSYVLKIHPFSMAYLIGGILVVGGVVWVSIVTSEVDLIKRFWCVEEDNEYSLLQNSFIYNQNFDYVGETP